ncbi:protein kinase [Nocardia sp. NPDC057663]|uniref:protein kinase domain-containing protein n=1 Tax=Nocardia sp. NPDC057663 TaxID=3346201 RepID=UPI00366B7CDE
MPDDDSLQTRREVVTPLTAELAAAGFDDALEIGHGGYGVVYRCWQVALERTVAVKVLTAELDIDNQARFLREQRAMGRMTGHPNIVTVLAAGATGSGHPYLVMPYYPLGSLDAWIRRGGSIPVEQAVLVGLKIAGSLASAHQRGIVHRDVKPGNILLSDYGEPMLTDFGIAHVAGGFRTSEGTLTGSPAFIAPEVLEGDTPTPAADIYGLGATLFCALTGHAAFERRSGENVVTQFLRITTHPVPDLRESGLPEDVAALVATAMNRNASQRPTASAFGELARQVQRDHQFTVDVMALPANLRPEAQNETDRTPPSAAPSVADRVSDGFRGNLPLELTSFINRRAELAKVKDLLSTSRLVTLTGTGGVGKTRLALRAASAVSFDFADGAWLVALADISDSALLTDVIAAALGVRDESFSPLLEVLTGFLIPRHALIVLDNCEHIVDAVAPLASTLLQRCPDLRILATSREPLNIAGEALVHVVPLGVPEPGQEVAPATMSSFDAMALFSDRAAAAVPGFHVDQANVSAVAQICTRIEGLPLAIELAAARLRSMSTDQILQHLDDRYSLLSRGSRDAPMRQQTMQWCIDWSYELCVPVEQRMWARLSVFAGGFELDAVEAICSGGLPLQSALDALSSLVDKSIVDRQEMGTVVRFRMFEALREYGRHKLRMFDEDLELRRRHRDWYQKLAVDAEAGWIGHQQPDWIARLDREQFNIREALESLLAEGSADAAQAGLRTAAALYEFWFFRGLYGEGRSWLARALDQSHVGSVADRVAALRAITQLAAAHGDFTSATAHLSDAQRLAAHSPDPMIRAQVDHAEGSLALLSGDPIRACGSLRRAVRTLDAQRTSARYINALAYLGWASEVLGDFAQSEKRHQELLAVTEPCGELFYRCGALRGLAVAAWQRGENRRAQQMVKEALNLNRRLNSPIAAAFNLQAMAWITAADNDFERAAVLLGAADGLWPASSADTTVFPNMSPFRTECERTTRRSLGERLFHIAYQRGHGLSPDVATDFALQDRPTPHT